MTNLERLSLELAHKNYFSNEEYTVLLEENGLDATKEYNKISDQLGLLQTVVAVFEALQGNIDLFRTVNTEFSTNTSAYQNIKDRIDQLNKRIASIPEHQRTNKTITYIFSN
jgi:hypothetical protein